MILSGADRGGLIMVRWRPHRESGFPVPGTVIAGGPECSHRRGWRMVSLERWAEFPSPGGLPFVTAASWEVADTDLVLTAGAIDAQEQREQLRIIHSLQQ
jgi:hypothetical protein